MFNPGIHRISGIGSVAVVCLRGLARVRGVVSAGACGRGLVDSRAQYRWFTIP